MANDINQYNDQYEQFNVGNTYLICVKYLLILYVYFKQKLECRYNG